MKSYSPLMKRLSCVLIAWAIFVHANNPVHAYDDDLGFRTAADYLNRGMYLESMGMYQEVAEYSVNMENRARAVLYIATTCSLYLDQPDAALERFNFILKYYPATMAARDALFNSGMVLYEKGAYAEAHEAFTAYIRRYPQGSHFQSAQVWADSAKSSMTEAPPPGLPAAPAPAGLVIKDTVIRVLLDQNAQEIVLQADQPMTASDRVTGQALIAPATRISIAPNGEGFNLNGQTVASRECRFSANGNPLRYKNHRFRGDMVVARQNGRMDLTNHVPVEEYVYGVVPKEMSPEWSSQALMAQAVAARTYALYIKSKSGDKAYDVQATTASQVYGGMDAEKAASNQAVDATRGQVMTHDNKLIIAYFHANSGGFTEDPGNVWSAGVPYLKSVRDDYSLDTPGSQWEYRLSYQSAQALLGKSGMDVGSVSGMDMGEKTPSGRCTRVYVITAGGKKELTSNNFRIKIGATNVKSTLFEMQPAEGGILLKGRGYGHGVGMSQWGAYRMAQNKSTYTEILKHYYYNVEIVAISS